MKTNGFEIRASSYWHICVTMPRTGRICKWVFSQRCFLHACRPMQGSSATVLQSHPARMLSSLKRPLLLFSPNTLLLRWSVETLQLQISYAHQLQSWGRSGTSLRTGFGFSVSNRPLSVTPKGTAWIQSFISKIQHSSHRNTRIWSLWGGDHIHWAGWSGPTPSPFPNVTEVQE